MASSFFSLLTSPLVRVRLDDSSDDNGIDVVWYITAFLGLGMYLVIQKYNEMRNRPIAFTCRIPEQSRLDWEGTKLKNPSLTSHEQQPELLSSQSSSRKSLTCFDPATGMHIATLRAHTAADISQKIDRAAHAQETWKLSSWAERRRVIRSLQAWLVKEQEACARVACRDTGKTMIDASFGEILTTCSKMDWLLKHGENVLKPSKRNENLILCYKRSQVHYDPLGVVAAIVSWNYPLHNVIAPIIAAIFAGNAVVVKCSEYVAWSSRWYVSVVRECLAACGWNPDIVQLVVCYPEDAEALTKSPIIKHITFIGSETVGRKVAQAALEHLTPVTLELGGKDPAIILEGTRVKQWSSTWMRGVFQAMGQNCIGVERFIVHSSVYSEFVREMESRISKLRLGPSLVTSPIGEDPAFVVDAGSMINDTRFASLEKIIQAAVQEGARLVCGGRRKAHPLHEKASYFEPTLLTNVTNYMEIAQEEVFGPIMLVMKFDTIEEAITLANGTKYGLGASVFGPFQRDCAKVARQLECGMVAINDFGVFYLNQDLPFGGAKSSGYGRFAGPEGLRSLTNLKVIMSDRFAGFIQTSIPGVVDYPIKSALVSWQFVSGLVRFLYAYSWWDSIDGLIQLIRANR